VRHTPEVDLLESGADRAPARSRAAAALGHAAGVVRRRPPPRAVQAVGVAAVATAAAGALALAPVGARIDRAEQQTAQAAARTAQAAAQAAEPDLAARPLGGTATRTGDGAAGVLALEVRNGRQPLRLLSVTARVPGVSFRPVTYRGGRVLSTDDRLELRLSYVVPDCARLRRTGELVLRVAASGIERDLTLAVAADPRAGSARQFDLDVVLDACG
jgi:hypothetical protein